MCKILLIIILILVLIIIILFILKNKNFEFFENYIDNNSIFLNKNELLYILETNIDNYYDTFTPKDLSARKVENINQYITKIEESVSEFTTDQKKILEKCIKIVFKILNKINFEYFNGEKANEIPWKIGCIKGDGYEAGLPHTRNDVIILNKNSVNNTNLNNLISVLIHEKVHVYQKMYPEDVKKYLQKFNFKRIEPRPENVRANPDIDKWIYKDNLKVYKAIYNNNPSSVGDVKYSSNHDGQKSEHPFEKMAIEIEDLYSKYL